MTKGIVDGIIGNERLLFIKHFFLVVFTHVQDNACHKRNENDKKYDDLSCHILQS